MKCTKCGGKTIINLTIQATDRTKTQSAECVECHTRFTVLSVLVCEVVAQGDGPYALAQRLKAGEEPLDLLAAAQGAD